MKYFLLTLLLTPLLAISQPCSSYLVSEEVTKPDKTYGYLDYYCFKDTCGNIIIPFEKYPMVYTDTFRTVATVLLDSGGFACIDRNEKVLFHVFPFDNGPDEPAEGFIRIIENNKIGYADQQGHIIIPPRYACAWQFEDSIARVSYNCTSETDGEHTTWLSNDWFYINRKGNRIHESKNEYYFLATGDPDTTPCISSLEGYLDIENFYGPPGYGEDPANDEIEKCYILTTDSLTRLKMRGDREGRPLEEYSMSLKKIQSLAFHITLSSYINKRVRLTGELFERQTGHHHTRVMMEVRKIEALK